MTDNKNVAAAADLAVELHRLLPKPCRDRPFECDGLPQTCDVMLIGTNPATDLGDDWWLHWSDAEGRKKTAACQAYISARKKLLERKRATGNTRARLISPTHSRIDLLDKRLHASGCRLLVTNVFRNGQSKGAGPERVSNLAIIHLLSAHMPRLAVVIVLGNMAWEELRSTTFPRGIEPDKRHHFARGWSYAAIDELADETLQSIRRAATT